MQYPEYPEYPKYPEDPEYPATPSDLRAIDSSIFWFCVMDIDRPCTAPGPPRPVATLASRCGGISSSPSTPGAADSIRDSCTQHKATARAVVVASEYATSRNMVQEAARSRRGCAWAQRQLLFWQVAAAVAAGALHDAKGNIPLRWRGMRQSHVQM
jgi:hypothetical protein